MRVCVDASSRAGTGVAIVAWLLRNDRLRRPAGSKPPIAGTEPHATDVRTAAARDARRAEIAWGRAS